MNIAGLSSAALCWKGIWRKSNGRLLHRRPRICAFYETCPPRKYCRHSAASSFISTVGEYLASLVASREKQGVSVNPIANWELEIDTYRRTDRRRRADAELKRQQRFERGWAVPPKAAELLLLDRFAAHRGMAAFGFLIGQSIFDNLTVITRYATFSRSPIYLIWHFCP